MLEKETNKPIKSGFISALMNDFISYWNAVFAKKSELADKADKTEIIFVKNSRGNIVYKGDE